MQARLWTSRCINPPTFPTSLVIVWENSTHSSLLKNRQTIKLDILLVDIFQIFHTQKLFEGNLMYDFA